MTEKEALGFGREGTFGQVPGVLDEVKKTQYWEIDKTNWKYDYIVIEYFLEAIVLQGGWPPIPKR